MKAAKCGFISILALMLAGCRPQSESPHASDCYALVHYTVPNEQIPPQITEIYHQKVGDSPVVRSQICIAGDRLMFYALRFRKETVLREITIAPDGKSILVYDVPEK